MVVGKHVSGLLQTSRKETKGGPARSCYGGFDSARVKSNKVSKYDGDTPPSPTKQGAGEANARAKIQKISEDVQTAELGSAKE